MFADGDSVRVPGPVVADTPAEAALRAAELLLAVLEPLAAADGERRLSVALAGGTTPRLLYQLLSSRFAARLPWHRLDLFLGDERCVPADDPQSNAGLVRAALLDPARPASQAARLHLLYRGDEPPDDAAAAAEASLPPSLDLLLVGMGPDGHVCSLFPGHPALDERRRRVVAVHDSPKPPPRRITLAPPALAAARHVLVLATGAEKAEAVAAALADEGEVARCPARLCRRGTFVLDRAAAARLPTFTPATST